MFVGEVHRAGGFEVRRDGEFDVVDTALHQAIDIQEAGVDVDRAHREHARLRHTDRGLQARERSVVVVVVQLLVRAIVVVDLGAEGLVEGDVLTRVAVGVVPIFGRQIEVARGRQINGCGAQVARDIDAAFLVGELERTGCIHDLAAHINVLRRIGQVEACERGVELLGIGILHDVDHAGCCRRRAAYRRTVEPHRTRIHHHTRTVHPLGDGA